MGTATHGTSLALRNLCQSFPALVGTLGSRCISWRRASSICPPSHPVDSPLGPQGASCAPRQPGLATTSAGCAGARTWRAHLPRGPASAPSSAHTSGAPPLAAPAPPHMALAAVGQLWEHAPTGACPAPTPRRAAFQRTALPALSCHVPTAHWHMAPCVKVGKSIAAGAPTLNLGKELVRIRRDSSAPSRTRPAHRPSGGGSMPAGIAAANRPFPPLTLASRPAASPPHTSCGPPSEAPITSATPRAGMPQGRICLATAAAAGGAGVPQVPPLAVGSVPRACYQAPPPPLHRPGCCKYVWTVREGPPRLVHVSRVSRVGPGPQALLRNDGLWPCAGICHMALRSAPCSSCPKCPALGAHAPAAARRSAKRQRRIDCMCRMCVLRKGLG